MSYPLDNLGDYGKVTVDLKNAGGSRDALYMTIGSIAVAAVASIHLVVGVAVKKAFPKIKYLLKKQKQSTDAESALKEELENPLDESTKAEATNSDDEIIVDGESDME